ncbi:MAG TPA: glutamate racemase [Acidimicrobiia bacterium]
MIGVFDSGVGGLAVLREIRDLLPDADLIYVADRRRAPYGTRTLSEVSSIAHEVTEWLIDAGALCVVIACNTASAAALHSIRDAHPDLPIVGMEPAVKPAAQGTVTGTVAVYATEATFQGELFDSVVSRFAAGVEVLTRACPEWVELVERGVVNGPEAETAVNRAVDEAVDAGADQIVLACTHFSFLAPVIERVSGIEVIDPAPAVATQATRVAPGTDGAGTTTLAASGDIDEFSTLARRLAYFAQPVIRFAP